MVAVRHMKTHLVGSRSPLAAFLPPSHVEHRDVRRGYFRRVTEFIGLVPSGFHGRELPCIIAARRNQTGHRTSNGAPAAAYKLEESRHDFRALPWRIAFVYFRRLFHGLPDSFRPYSGLLTTGHLLKIVL